MYDLTIETPLSDLRSLRRLRRVSCLLTFVNHMFTISTQYRFTSAHGKSFEANGSPA